MEFPLGLMTVVSGVSGSGKSTLVNDIVARELAAELNRATTAPGLHSAIEGVNLLDKAIVIDQSPNWSNAALQSSNIYWDFYTDSRAFRQHTRG